MILEGKPVAEHVLAGVRAGVERLRAGRGVTPKPAAAFSTLTTARSIACSWRSLGRSFFTAARPGSPKTSPTIRIFMPAYFATSTARVSRMTTTLM